jgi:hypothetical protein
LDSTLTKHPCPNLFGRGPPLIGEASTVPTEPVAFFNAQEHFAIVGDVLFSGSVNRIAAPGESASIQMRPP